MGRPKIPDPSLPLFDEVTWAEALELATRFPVGVTLAQSYRRCRGACCVGNKGHGPYWYAQVGGSRRYVGLEGAHRRLLAAWERVRHEIERLEREEREAEARKVLRLPAAGDGRTRARKLRELRALVAKAGPRRARDARDDRTAAIPIVGAAK